MALGRADHKRIALGILGELRKVMGHANGSRLLDKHKARMGMKPGGSLAEDPGEEESPDELEALLNCCDEHECCDEQECEEPTGEHDLKVKVDPKRMKLPPHRGR